MHTTKKLLELLTAAVPPFEGGKHAIVLYENKLMVVLAGGPTEWRHFTLEDGDFDRTAEDLAKDILDILGAEKYDRKKKNPCPDCGQEEYGCGIDCPKHPDRKA